MIGGMAQAGNRTGKTQHYLQWQDTGLECDAETSGEYWASQLHLFCESSLGRPQAESYQSSGTFYQHLPKFCQNDFTKVYQLQILNDFAMSNNFFEYCWYRSHFGSRYKSGPCFTAGLLACIPGSILARYELNIEMFWTKDPSRTPLGLPKGSSRTPQKFLKGSLRIL